MCRKDCASGAGWQAVPVSQNQVANRGSWGLEKAAQAPGIFFEKALVWKLWVEEAQCKVSRVGDEFCYEVMMAGPAELFWRDEEAQMPRVML